MGCPFLAFFFISAHELLMTIFPLKYCRTILLKLASLCVYIVVLNAEVKCIRDPPSAFQCKKVYHILFLFKLFGIPEKVYRSGSRVMNLALING